MTHRVDITSSFVIGALAKLINHDGNLQILTNQFNKMPERKSSDRSISLTALA